MKINEEIMEKAHEIIAQRKKNEEKYEEERCYVETCFNALLCPYCGKPVKKETRIADDTYFPRTSCFYICPQHGKMTQWSEISCEE